MFCGSWTIVWMGWLERHYESKKFWKDSKPFWNIMSIVYCEKYILFSLYVKPDLFSLQTYWKIMFVFIFFNVDKVCNEDLIIYGLRTIIIKVLRTLGSVTEYIIVAYT